MRSQAAVIADIARLVDGDERIAGAWLEGSHATGDADEWSDIDLHVAVEDDSFEAAASADGLRAFAASVAPILGARRIPLGPDVAMLHATLAGPLRLDLYVERRSASAAVPRLDRPTVLVDRVGLAFRVDPVDAVPPATWPADTTTPPRSRTPSSP